MIRVLIAEDSPTTVDLLTEILESDGDMQVVGAARNGREAVNMVKRLRPDVVVMDIQMPELDGFEATRLIMIESPTPIVIVSATVDVRQTKISMQALRMGALTVMQKPAPGIGFEQLVTRFNATVRAMAGVRVVRRWSDKPQFEQASREVVPAAPIRVVAIATSTGGPAALHRVFSDMPANFAVPILVVQHIAPGFVTGLANWLGETSRLAIKVAAPGELPRAGTVYLAPDARHMGITAQGAIEISKAPAVDGFRPSASVLFRSVARSFGASALAVIMTGMGDDGLEGLRAVHSAGGLIIAQDEASSVVFGMPGVVVSAGLADLTLPLHRIAPQLQKIVSDATARQGVSS
jgi:two-component system, chemotaxis family, protein-glutamate methylesterase/glutaminase